MYRPLKLIENFNNEKALNSIEILHVVCNIHVHVLHTLYAYYMSCIHVCMLYSIHVCILTSTQKQDVKE